MQTMEIKLTLSEAETIRRLDDIIEAAGSCSAIIEAETSSREEIREAYSVVIEKMTDLIEKQQKDIWTLIEAGKALAAGNRHKAAPL